MAADVGAHGDKVTGPRTRGSVEVMSRDEVMGCPRWASAFAGKHKDHRYYELVEDTIQPDFVFRYFRHQGRGRQRLRLSTRSSSSLIRIYCSGGTNTRFEGVIGFVRRLLASLA